MIKKIKKHLALKIFIITSLILIGTSILTFLFFLFAASKTYIRELDSQLHDAAGQLIQELEKTNFDDSATLFDLFLENNPAELELSDHEGIPVMLPTRITSFPDYTVIDVTDISATEGYDDPVSNFSLYNSATKSYSVHFQDRNETYVLEVTGIRQNMYELISSIITVLPYWCIIVLFISLLAALLYSAFITRPITAISSISKNMAQLDFQKSCQVSRSDEIGILADNLNTLSTNLADALDELKEKNTLLLSDIEKEKRLEKKRLEFFTSISHELKTPITILKGQLQGMIYNIGEYQDHVKFLRKSMKTVLNMENMVQELLTIARIDSSNTPPNRVEVNLSAMLSRICYELEDKAAMNGITLEICIEPQISFTAEPSLLEKAFTNIIVNGINYSPYESHVTVELFQSDSEITFICENYGVQIPPEHLPELFAPFYRIETSRNKESGGTGLGLYIVKTSLDLHKAAYSITNSDNSVIFKTMFSRNNTFT